MMRSVGRIVLLLKPGDQRDGRGRIEEATRQDGGEEQAHLRDGERGFFET